MYPIFLALLLLSSNQAFSMVTLNPFLALEELNNQQTRPPCKENDCPSPLKKFNDQAFNAFVYRIIHQDVPANKCLKDKIIPPVSELKHTYINTLETSHTSPYSFQSSCAPDIQDAEQRQSLLLTQHQYYHERLNRGAIQSLSALHAIDSILDVPSSINDLTCNTHLSPKVEKACKKIKQCPRKSQRDAHVELIFSSLAKRMELTDSLRKIKRKIADDTRKSKANEKTKQHLQNLKDVRDTLETSIAEIESLVPWIKGRIFKKNLSKIEENIKKKEKDQLIKNQIRASLFLQAQANQKELLRLYDQFGEAADCLQGIGRCDRFGKIIKKAPPALPLENPYSPMLPPDIKKAYQQFEIVQCMEQEVDTARTYNDIAQSVGEIGLGFAIGGFGGVSALAINSARLLSNGYRLKGALSLMGLGTLGITTYKNFNLLKSKCKDASRHVVGLRQTNAQAACLPQDYPQNVSRYLSCMTELALTAAVIVPPILGKGTIKISKSQSKKTLAKNNKKNEQEIKEFKALLDDQESAEFVKLLDEFSPQELGTIRPYLKFIRQENIDPLVLHRALRYSRTLSPAKRQQFITHLDEALKGEVDSVNRNIRSFVKGEKRHAKRVAKLEKKYGDKLSPQARKTAQKTSHKIEDVILSCRARNMNASHQRSIALFGKITTGLMGVSIVSGFSNANWHLPKDTEWFGRLSYELVYAMMCTKILVKVMKNPSSSLVKRYGQFNVGSTLVEGIDTTMYSQFFDISEEDARDALNRIKNSPKKKKALEQLSRYLDDVNFVDTFKKTAAENFKKMMKTQENPFEKTEEDLPENLANLKDKDLDDPKVQDQLLEAIMEQYYDSERGYFNLGSMFTDRFAYSRAWSSMVGIPKNLAMAIPLYYSLCLTAAYPVGGLAAAAGIQALNQLTSADWYYKSRAYLINQ